ncbi:MAG: AAA-like domain-containing protein [Woeseiaceae bacterium]
MNTDKLQVGATTRQTRPSFFCTSGPLAADRPGYIRRECDAQLIAAIEGGTFVNVVGAPMMGKTSLLLKAAHELRERDDGPAVALIDLSPLAQRESHGDPARWLYAIAFRLSRQLRISFDLQAWWSDNAMLSHQQRMFELFREFVLALPSRQVVLMFDDIDEPELADAIESLLTAIRLAFDARATDPAMARLSIVMAGCGADQFGQEAAPARPFGIATKLPIARFTLGETSKLGPALGLPRASADLAMQRIYDWAAGQPATTQYLAHALARTDCEQDVVGFVDLLIERKFATQRDGQAHQVLLATESAFLELPVAEREPLLVMLGSIAKHRRALFDPESATQNYLLCYGVLELGADGYLTSTSRLFRQYFNAGWANRHIRSSYGGIAAALLLLGLLLLVPYWYQAVLPKASTAVMADSGSSVGEIMLAHERLSRWPGYERASRRMASNALLQKADQAKTEPALLEAVVPLRERLDNMSQGDSAVAAYWYREAATASRTGDRAAALYAAIKADVGVTDHAKRMIAGLLGRDLSRLQHVIRTETPFEQWAMRRRDRLVVTRSGALISEWPLIAGRVLPDRSSELEAYTVTRRPFVRRIEVAVGTTRNTLALSIESTHERPEDVALELLAPNGRTVTVTLDHFEDFADPGRIVLADFPEFRPLVSSPVAGEWTITAVDTRPGVTGRVGLSLDVDDDRSARLDMQLLPDPLRVAAADVVLSPAGRYAIAIPEDVGDSYSVWDLRERAIIATFSYGSETQWLGLSALARSVVMLDAARIVGFRTRTGRAMAWQSLQDPVLAAWLSDNGRWIGVRPVAKENVLRIVDLLADTAIDVRIDESYSSVVISASGRFIAVQGNDRQLRLIRVEDSEVVSEYPLNVAVGQGFFSTSDEQYVVGGVAGGLVVLPVSGETQLSSWSPEQVWQTALDGQTGMALVGSRDRGFRLHDFDRGRDRSAPFLGLDGNGVPEAYLRLNDNRAALADAADGRVLLWQPELTALPLGSRLVRKSWLSNDARAFAFIDRNDQFAVIRLDAGPAELDQLEEEVSMIAHSEPPMLVRFSKNSALALSIEQSGLFRVRDIGSGQFFDFLGRTPDRVIDAAFSADGQQFLLLGSQSLEVYDATSGERLHREIRDDAMLGVAATSDQSGWLIADATGRLSFLARVLSAQPAALVMREETVTLPVDLMQPVDERILLLAAGSRLQIVARGQAASTWLNLASKISDIRVSDNQKFAIVRAGQWLHRISFSGATADVTHSRLLPVEVLGHQGFSIADPKAMMIHLLSGLDEPELRSIAMDYGDETPVEETQEVLLKKWQWLAQ